MTVPTQLPAMPAASRGGSSPRASSAHDPAFASALGSALQTTRETPRDAGSDDSADTGPGSSRARTDARTSDARRTDAQRTDARATGSRDAETRTTDSPTTDSPTTRPVATDAADADPAESTDDADESATPAPVPLAPGLWALLAAATPITVPAPTAPAPTGPTTVDPATAVVAAPGAPVTPVLPLPVPAGTVLAGTVMPGTDPTNGAPTVTGVPTDGLPVPATPPPPGVLPAPATTAPVAAAPVAGGPADTAAAAITVVRDPAPAATPPSGAAPATDLPPVLLPAPGWAGSSTGTSTDTPDGRSGGPATPALATADPVAPTADTDSVFTLGGTAPTTATTTTAQAPAAAVPQAPVAQQLGRHIAVLRNAPDGSQTMTVVVTPDDLGPVTIAVTVSGGTLDLKLHGAHEAGRHALLEALPELRRDLEGAGLSLRGLAVDTATGDPDPGSRSPQQQLLDARAGQQGSAGHPGQQVPRGRAWGAAPAPLVAGTPATSTDQSASTGVDVRV